ncbi:hypothetical protein G6M50_38200 [Agrobacterium rhizogenes]|nr:hypothetical protein [Rhizobium rhizogenes]NTJ83620.1 hypothetical protein [Rhizobium rhizogenes]
MAKPVNSQKTLTNLKETVGDRAIEAQRLLRDVRHLKGHLSVSFADWKATRGIEFVERGSDQWEEMLKALSEDYAELENARRLYRNAQRRLETAIRWYVDAAWAS